jgi:dTDP-4-dehydrorhamnose 3,5-epimerase
MNIKESQVIPDLKIITPDVFHDFRGEYVETWNAKDWNLAPAHYGRTDITFVQDDISCSTKHVLRGLHGDKNTWKLIQCLQGSIYVVVVDCRGKKNTTMWHEKPPYEAFSLNDHTRQQILIPPGCANGHLCMSDTCIFHYKQTTYYEGAQTQFTLKWDSAGIFWPVACPIVSERDKNGTYWMNLQT